jgi:hypothetical protein
LKEEYGALPSETASPLGPFSVFITSPLAFLVSFPGPGGLNLKDSTELSA